MSEKLVKIVNLLCKEENLSPSKISSIIKSDRRTTKKIIESGIKLGILEIDKIQIGEREYSSVNLDKNYKKLLHNNGNVKNE